MFLESLKIHSVRNLTPVDLQFSAGINLISGINGSGKTSFLEAISILSNGHSFRSRDIKKIIQYQSDHLVVSGIVHNQTTDRSIPVGIQRGDKCVAKVTVDSERQSKLSALTRCLPTLAIDSRSIEIIEGSPSHRRSILDWGLFHVEHSYLGFIQSYRKSLMQKQELLKASKNPDKSQISHWNRLIGKYGEDLHRCRMAYLEKLEPYIHSVFEQRFDLPEFVTIHYHPGWNKPKYGNLFDCLDANMEQDIYRKTTYYGPHRADIQFLHNGKEAKDICSRGQKKLLLYGVRLAQIALMRDATGEAPILLLDDLPSELDGVNQKKIMTFLSDFNCQAFITAIDPQDAKSLLSLEVSNFSMFHVEHGTLRILA